MGLRNPVGKRDSNHKDETIMRKSYRYNENSSTGKAIFCTESDPFVVSLPKGDPPQVGWHWICTGDVNPCLYVKCIVLKLKCFIQVSVSIYRGHIVLNLVKCTAVKFQPYVVFRENMYSTYLDICTRRLRRFCCGYECVIKYTSSWGVM